MASLMSRPCLGQHLVSRVVNSFTVSGESSEDLVGGLGPDERPGVLVPLVDPLADVVFKLGDHPGGAEIRDERRPDPGPVQVITLTCSL